MGIKGHGDLENPHVNATCGRTRRLSPRRPCEQGSAPAEVAVVAKLEALTLEDVKICLVFMEAANECSESLLQNWRAI
jgi:hypothetical protein